MPKIKPEDETTSLDSQQPQEHIFVRQPSDETNDGQGTHTVLTRSEKSWLRRGECWGRRLSALKQFTRKAVKKIV